MSDTYKLKAIKFCSFQKSVVTNWDEWKKDKRFQGELKGNEVYLFVSLTGDNLAFILGEYNVDGIRALDVRRVTLDQRYPWNPSMLQNYAKQAGLALQGFRTLEEQFEERHEEKLQAARDARAALKEEEAAA